MEKKSYTNNNSILREKTLQFFTEPERKRIENICYYGPSGTCLESYHRNPVFVSEKNFSINDDTIIKAGYLLCRFSPQKFYNLYRLTLNEKDRELLKKSLAKVYEEYKKFEVEGNFESEIKDPEFDFYSGKYHCTTEKDVLNIFSIDINLDSRNNIESCGEQNKINERCQSGNIKIYCKEPKSNFNSHIEESPLDKEIVKRKRGETKWVDFGTL